MPFEKAIEELAAASGRSVATVKGSILAVVVGFERPKECNCFPHGPDQPCTCEGCWACSGHQLGCTCDINWDCEHRRDT